MTGVDQIQSGSRYTIVNALSQLALDNSNASQTNGTKIQQWNCNRSDQQNWTFTAVGAGTYTIVNQLSGKALDDTNASMANGTIMQQWTPNGFDQQRWVPNAVGNGAYTLVNYLSGKALDGTNASKANGTQIQQWTPNGFDQQKWIIVPAGTCAYSGFNILVDVNQLNLDEANNDAQLAADGVWALTTNSCDGCAPNPPITDPNGTWPGALARLNAAAWTVTEDVYPDYTNNQLVKQYRNGPVSAAMVYYEHGWPNPQMAPNDTILLTSEIDAASAATGNSIVVLSRTYKSNDARSGYVRQALTDNACSGVVFESLPAYSAISGQNFNQGIADILNAGRNAYILLAPNTVGGSYAADVQSGVSQYLANSPQLGNPNLYIVLAAYAIQDTGTGFLQPAWGPSGNTVIAAENWLKSYRQAQFGR